jgi:hypothetical protein
MRNTSKKKIVRPAPVAAPVGHTSDLPQLFTAPTLARYLGIPKSMVRKLNIPRVVLGHRTKLYALEDVLARVDELKKVGVA